MDSLLSNYASSDDEEEEEDQIPIPNPNSQLSNPPQTLTLTSQSNPNSQSQFQIPQKPTSLFSSLPKPNSSISQLSPISPPNPNSQSQFQIPQKPTSLFSSLPKPNSKPSQFSLIPPPIAKKVVTISRSIIKPSKLDNDDDDDIEREDRRREVRKTESFTKAASGLSFLSSLPAAKNSSSTLGVLPSALGSGRKSIIETNVPSSNVTSFSTGSQVGVSSNEVNYNGSSVNPEYEISSGNTEYEENYVGSSTNAEYESYDGNGGYGNYDYYSQYTWGDGSAEVAQSSGFGVSESVMKVPGKRGRNEIPTEIVEVKQDDLTKNRPREDQVKSTGIAFGPAYQPVSTKGKPSKLQKRKHQIGSLYFDMRQKESELAERRSKGFLTKAETQAKYGW